MVQMDEKLTKQLSTVMFIATILVVMCHVDDVINLKNCNWVNDGIVRFLGGAFTDANVANFFFLSGFFLARHYGTERWWENAMAKRVRTLWIPYILWCLIYFFIQCCFSVTKRIILKMPINECLCMQFLSQPDLGLTEIFGLGFLDAPYCFSLWYIKSLMWFILVSPIFFPLVNKYGYKILCVFLFTIYLIACMLKLRIFGLPGFHIIGFGCFLTGATIVFHPLQLPKFHSIIFPVLWLCIWIISAIILMILPYPLRTFWNPINIAIEVAMLNLLVISIKWRIPTWAVKAAFMIYVLHILILRMFSHTLIPFMQRFLPSFPIYLIVLSFTIFMCMVITLILKKERPKLSAVLSGGRC